MKTPTDKINVKSEINKIDEDQIFKLNNGLEEPIDQNFKKYYNEL